LSDQVILRVTTKLILPAVFLFALYVQFHGDYGPGGGFQAGVILAAGFILYALVFGLRRTQKVLPSWVSRLCASLGVLLYVAVGIASMILGAPFLDYSVLAHEVHQGQHLGILLIELGVLITVFGVMLSIFYFFAGRGREEV
jgi:multicomponent Na+:H+ antiporter subunit B